MASYHGSHHTPPPQYIEHNHNQHHNQQQQQQQQQHPQYIEQINPELMRGMTQSSIGTSMGTPVPTDYSNQNGQPQLQQNVSSASGFPQYQPQVNPQVMQYSDGNGQQYYQQHQHPQQPNMNGSQPNMNGSQPNMNGS
eukprot:946335_1